MAAPTNMTKEQRVERARIAGRAAQLVSSVKTVTTRAQEFTPDQREAMINALVTVRTS